MAVEGIRDVALTAGYIGDISSGGIVLHDPEQPLEHVIELGVGIPHDVALALIDDLNEVLARIHVSQPRVQAAFRAIRRQTPIGRLHDNLAHGPLWETCYFCERPITQSVKDDAWEDEDGACGCGDGEHEPVRDPAGKTFRDVHGRFPWETEADAKLADGWQAQMRRLMGL